MSLLGNLSMKEVNGGAIIHYTTVYNNICANLRYTCVHLNNTELKVTLINNCVLPQKKIKPGQNCKG